ncbi:MAG: transporter substrate-binding protein [Solirubrobacterales bacterium]|nr:transporter substrate-binding protein [Solirubrobacterales bacterium]
MDDNTLAGRSTRRSLLKMAGAGAASLSVPSFLAACGSANDTTSTTAAVTTAGPLSVSSGGTIPTKTVKFGMAPFADATFYVIAMRQGWFKDVGIDIAPAPTGLQVTPDNVVTKLVTGEADIATFYGPGKIATMGKAPQLKMFGFSDTYVGTYILVSPSAKQQTVSELVAGGMPFEAAVKQALAPMKGKPVAFSNTGQHRDFLDQAFKLGGLTFSDVKVTATTDAKILQLAKGGQTDYTSPEGAAQNIELLNDGWVPLVSVDDLLKGLPPGDPRSVAAVGHEGPACSDEYFAANRETCLRFISVMFRTIDAIASDPARYLADQIPYQESVSGTKSSVQDLKSIYTNNDPLIPFDEQTQYWTKLDAPTSYKTIYDAQIASAQKGGVLPNGKTFTADQAIIGKEVYDQLVALRKGYDGLAAKASGLSGAEKTMAAAAKKQYDARNYLDAYRMLKTATAKV